MERCQEGLQGLNLSQGKLSWGSRSFGVWEIRGLVFPTRAETEFSPCEVLAGSGPPVGSVGSQPLNLVQIIKHSCTPTMLPSQGWEW